ncbi:MAG TPA: ATP-binding protein, partial [Pseudobdellovibrionaceae bacterium]|nr:ATP-binding protein [Pseudobdellovibrionaceae bacterium]
EATDTSLTVFMISAIAYSLAFMWLAPMYEIAYLQVAIGSAFFRLRRAWIFPLLFGLGFVGILANHHWQEALGWSLPPVARSDWAFVAFVFFALAWAIQKYAIGTFRREQERMARFGAIGKEATKLVHDIKGLLSSPLLLIDALNEQARRVPAGGPFPYEEQLRLLAKDMAGVREVAKSINRLVLLNDRVQSVDVHGPLESSLGILERRLRHVSVSLPENRRVRGNQERLQSIFFNLLLNALEAFESVGTLAPRIDISWNGSTLEFRNNSGSENRRKPHGTGLGLEIVAEDLEKIGARFEIASGVSETTIRIHFVPA